MLFNTVRELKIELKPRHKSVLDPNCMKPYLYTYIFGPKMDFTLWRSFLGIEQPLF